MSLSVLSFFFFLIILSSYAQPPQNTVFIEPDQDIQAIIDSYSENTLYIFKVGIHRMQKIIPKSKDILIGEPGAIINGSLILDTWVPEGNYWTHTIDMNLAASFNGSNCHCEVEYPETPDPDCGYKRYGGCVWHQSMFIDHDYPLWREMSLSGLNNLPDTLMKQGIPVKPFYGDWYFDENTSKFIIPFDPTGHLIEVTINFPGADFAIHPGGGSVGGQLADSVLVKGFQIEKYAPTWGTVMVGETGWIVENNNVRLNHSDGINTRGDCIIRSNKANNNGRSGIGGQSKAHPNGNWGIIDNNEIAYNNFNRYSPGWSAVTKFIDSDGLILRNNHVHNNYGSGLWTDIRNRNILFEGNYVHDNGGAGIFHEISFDAVIRCNRVVNNRSRTKPEIGNLDFTQPIYISNGSNVLVEYNYIRQDTSGQGIVTTQNNRGMPDLGGCGTPVRVLNNDIVFSFPPVNNLASSILDTVTISICGDTLPVHLFDNNHYHIKGFDENKEYFAHFDENGIIQTYNWQAFQDAGFEVNGTLDTNIVDQVNYQECASIPKQILVKSKLFLDCFMDSDSSMVASGFIDLDHYHPFSSSPWNYTGRDVCPKFYDDMVDWVLLEIRASTSPDSILQQKAAVILKDGRIVDAYPSLQGAAQVGDRLDGVVFYDLIPNVEYILSVKTRNQTIAIASQSVHLPNAIHYDFTNPNEVENLNAFEHITSESIALKSIGVTATASDTMICRGDTVTLIASPNLIFNHTPNLLYKWNDGLSNIATLIISPEETTVYKVEITDEFGCSTHDEIEITVHDLPGQPSILGSTEVVAGVVEVYSIEDHNLSSHYNWTISGGTILINSDTAVSVIWGQVLPFELCVSETNGFGCDGMQNCMLIDILSGTAEVKLDSNLEVFPIPAIHKVYIKKPTYIEVLEITIFDPEGEFISKPSNLEIDISDLASGIYFMRIHTNKGIVLKKIIIYR